MTDTNTVPATDTQPADQDSPEFSTLVALTSAQPSDPLVRSWQSFIEARAVADDVDSRAAHQDEVVSAAEADVVLASRGRDELSRRQSEARAAVAAQADALSAALESYRSNLR